MTRVGVLPIEPPDRDRRFKHWVTSLTRVHDSLAIAELGVPWWTYRAIDVVDAWLMNRPSPIRVFEYGSGAPPCGSRTERTKSSRSSITEASPT